MTEFVDETYKAAVTHCSGEARRRFKDNRHSSLDELVGKGKEKDGGVIWGEQLIRYIYDEDFCSPEELREPDAG